MVVQPVLWTKSFVVSLIAFVAGPYSVIAQIAPPRDFNYYAVVGIVIALLTWMFGFIGSVVAVMAWLDTRIKSQIATANAVQTILISKEIEILRNDNSNRSSLVAKELELVRKDLSNFGGLLTKRRSEHGRSTDEKGGTDE